VEKDIKRGIFLTFEGPEGSGKSTQSDLVSKWLADEGYKVIRTAEPGGTALGEKIRAILLDKDEINVGHMSELLLFEADRAQHVEEVIIPALERKEIVICDRFNTATFAYQGYGLGLDMGLISCIDSAVRATIEPDMTVVLDIDVVTGMRRATSGRHADRMEKRETAFHDKVREGYLDMARKDPGKIKVINAAAGVEEVHREIKKEVHGLIERYTRAG
jgi:dTMP kinase